MHDVESRRQYKSSMAHQNVEHRHVSECRVLPTREALLDILPKGATAAEVGVAFGDFTKEIVARAKPNKLHLIDAWEGERYGGGLDRIQEQFATDINSGRIEINRGYSVPVLSKFDDAYFDWIYIDTNHSYATTKQELVIGAQKCKQGGRISGHDFTSGNVITPVPYGVIEACNEFCKNYDWQYEYITLEFHGHFSFCLKKI